MRTFTITIGWLCELFCSSWRTYVMHLYYIYWQKVIVKQKDDKMNELTKTDKLAFLYTILGVILSRLPIPSVTKILYGLSDIFGMSLQTTRVLVLLILLGMLSLFLLIRTIIKIHKNNKKIEEQKRNAPSCRLLG